MRRQLRQCQHNRHQHDDAAANANADDRAAAAKDSGPDEARGEQDQAKPVLKIVSPAKGAVINGSKVEVKLDLSGDLKGYMPHKDPATGKGNHVHVILDNQPYEAYYELGQPFELRNVVAGKHTLRVFPSVRGMKASKMRMRFRW